MRVIKLITVITGLGIVVFLIGMMTGEHFLAGPKPPSSFQPNMLLLPNLGVWGGSAAFLLLAWLARKRGEEGPSYWLSAVMPIIYICGLLTAFVMALAGVL
jgi:hypothetical protein